MSAQPQDPIEIQLNYAWRAQVECAWDNAIEKYSNVIAQCGDSEEAKYKRAEAHFGLHSVYATKGKHEEALRQYDAAIKLDNSLEIARDKYTITSILGTGGVSIVYEAISLREPNQPLCIKCVRQHLWDISNDFERDRQWLKAESDQLHKLSDIDGIPEPTHFESQPKTGLKIPYLVMRLIGGETLRSVLDRAQKAPALSANEALDIVSSVAATMAKAHTRNVYHFDLKPHNIIVDRQGTGGHKVAVIDFGCNCILEKVAYRHSLLTRGSTMYIPPEEKPTFAWDVYMLGVVLYEALAGSGKSPPIGGYRSPQRGSAAVDPILDEIILTAIDRAPDHRFASMGVFSQVLASVDRVRDQDGSGTIPEEVPARVIDPSVSGGVNMIKEVFWTRNWGKKHRIHDLLGTLAITGLICQIIIFSDLSFRTPSIAGFEYLRGGVLCVILLAAVTWEAFWLRMCWILPSGLRLEKLKMLVAGMVVLPPLCVPILLWRFGLDVWPSLLVGGICVVWTYLYVCSAYLDKSFKGEQGRWRDNVEIRNLLWSNLWQQLVYVLLLLAVQLMSSYGHLGEGLAYLVGTALLASGILIVKQLFTRFNPRELRRQEGVFVRITGGWGNWVKSTE